MYNDYFVPFPTIISKRVTLRRVRMSDKEPLFKMCSDLSSCEFSDWYPHVDRGDTAVFIRYLNKKYRKKELFSFGITLTENDRLIGTISIASINSAYTVAEIGYTLDADYRGLGYASESVKALCRFLTEKVGIKRIEAKTLPENANSRKLLEKLGFKLEAVLQNGAVIRGEVRDCCLYSLIPNE